MEFEERTIRIIVDESKCAGCASHVCVQACRKYARGILTMTDGKPALGGDAEFGKLRGTECLACEYECWFRGNGAISIEAPIPGLDEYRRKHGVS
jgi:hypothetical protein